MPIPLRQKTELIIIHCSATDDSADIGVKEIRSWHLARGWLDIGYHFVIRRDGTIETGRRLTEVGSHAHSYNNRSIGICLVGGVEADDKNRARDNYTPKQKASLRNLLIELRKKYPKTRIIGHRDVDKNKECPCFDVAEWLKYVEIPNEQN